jgi:hypothetical protein
MQLLPLLPLLPLLILVRLSQMLHCRHPPRRMYLRLRQGNGGELSQRGVIHGHGPDDDGGVRTLANVVFREGGLGGTVAQVIDIHAICNYLKFGNP